MTPGPGIEPGTHCWKASALTTAPTLFLKGGTPLKNYCDDHASLSSTTAVHICDPPGDFRE